MASRGKLLWMRKNHNSVEAYENMTILLTQFMTLQPRKFQCSWLLGPIHFTFIMSGFLKII